MISGPAPFNTVLWRVVGMQDSGYIEGFYSIFDKNLIQFNKYSSQDSLLKSIEKEWSIQRLKWFTKGFYKVSRDSNKIIMTDIRMGLESSYFFNFSVGEIKNGQIIAGRNDKLPPRQFDIKNSLRLLWKRIWNEDNQKLKL
jgi:inner membrane protein